MSTISFWTVFWLAILGVSLYAIFYVIEEMVIKLVKNRRARTSASWYFPIIKGIVWLLFVVFSTYQLIYSNLWIGLAIVMVLTVASWTFIRNYIMGLVLRMQGNFYPDQRVSYGAIEGVIKRFITTNMEIETDDGEIVVVPYSEFGSRLVRKPTLAKGLRQLSIQVPNKKGLSLPEVNSLVYNCPFIATSIEPKVSIQEENGVERIQMNVFLVNGQYERLVRAYFREAL